MGSQPLPKCGFTPLAGEDTRTVLTRMGYGADAIDAMIADGAVQ